MVADSEINAFVNAYCRLRDKQYAVYGRYAKQYNLTANELFVLDILWFSSEGCTQKEICERLSANKQTVAAITNRFFNKGYVTLNEYAKDRRNKLIRFTESGSAYAEKIIPPAAEAENLAMSGLGLKAVRELVKLTTAFLDNMEKEFKNIKERRYGIL